MVRRNPVCDSNHDPFFVAAMKDEVFSLHTRSPTIIIWVRREESPVSAFRFSISSHLFVPAAIVVALLLGGCDNPFTPAPPAAQNAPPTTTTDSTPAPPASQASAQQSMSVAELLSGSTSDVPSTPNTAPMPVNATPLGAKLGPSVSRLMTSTSRPPAVKSSALASASYAPRPLRSANLQRHGSPGPASPPAASQQSIDAARFARVVRVQPIHQPGGVILYDVVYAYQGENFHVRLDHDPADRLVLPVRGVE